MATQVPSEDIIEVGGMNTKASKTATPQGKVRLAQNCTFREPGALVKRSGYTKLNNSVPTN